MKLKTGTVLAVTMVVAAALDAAVVTVDDGAVLSGSGVLTGSLVLKGALSPGGDAVGAFTVQSNLTCDGGTFDLQAVSNTVADTVSAGGTVSGTGLVLLSVPFGVSPQDLAVIFGGAGSDYSGLSASPGWLVRQDGDHLLIHELVNDADGDGQSDYYETIAGTGLGDSNSLFQVMATVNLTNVPPVQFGFNSVTGRTYSLVFCTNLLEGVWTAVPEGAAVAGDGSDKQFAADLADSGEGFYRIEISRD